MKRRCEPPKYTACTPSDGVLGRIVSTAGIDGVGRAVWVHARHLTQKKMREVIRDQGIVTTASSYRQAVRQSAHLFVEQAAKAVGAAIRQAGRRFRAIDRRTKRRSASDAVLFTRAHHALAHRGSKMHKQAVEFARSLDRRRPVADSMRALNATFGSRALGMIRSSSRVPRAHRSSRAPRNVGREKSSSANAPPSPTGDPAPAPEDPDLPQTVGLVCNHLPAFDERGAGQAGARIHIHRPLETGRA